MTFVTSLKRRCYERGAEDNLTVVVVRVGETNKADERLDGPGTDDHARNATDVATQPEGNQTAVELEEQPLSRLRASPFPVLHASGCHECAGETQRGRSAPHKDGGSGPRVFCFLFVLLLIGGAFYAGARYKERIPFLAEPKHKPTPTPPVNTPSHRRTFVQFERARRKSIRIRAHGWPAKSSKELVNSGVQNPLDSPNPEFLYLYGRANLLTGNTDEAAKGLRRRDHQGGTRILPRPMPRSRRKRFSAWLPSA